MNLFFTNNIPVIFDGFVMYKDKLYRQIDDYNFQSVI